MWKMLIQFVKCCSGEKQHVNINLKETQKTNVKLRSEIHIKISCFFRSEMGRKLFEGLPRQSPRPEPIFSPYEFSPSFLNVQHLSMKV